MKTKTTIRKLIQTLCLLATLAAPTASGFYDPVLQRWLTLDPIGESGGINLYQFVGNDPVNKIDPDGRLAWGNPVQVADKRIALDPAFQGRATTFNYQAAKVGVGVSAGVLGGTVAAPFLAKAGVSAFLVSAGSGAAGGFTAELASQGVELASGELRCLSGTRLAVGTALGGGLGGTFHVTGQVVRNALSRVASSGSKPQPRSITILGSGRDVRPYANRPGFNVLNMDNLPESEWPRQNALWLNQALRRGDEIWLVTDPVKHTQLMQRLGKASFYLDLELPMLEQYGANAVPKFATSP